jgi:hypothetical protein
MLPCYYQGAVSIKNKRGEGLTSSLNYICSNWFKGPTESSTRLIYTERLESLCTNPFRYLCGNFIVKNQCLGKRINSNYDDFVFPRFPTWPRH